MAARLTLKGIELVDHAGDDHPADIGRLAFRTSRKRGRTLPS